MYTKARIAGHPIHPALIAFPVALYTSTVAALLVHLGTRDVFWYRAAMWTNVAGVVMAVVAAVPGLIDLLSLPRRSRARATGVRHAAFNVLALALFAISGVILWRNMHSPASEVVLNTTAPLVLGIVGLLATLTAGMLGWALVQTHHVGIKPTVYGSHRDPSVVDDLDELAVGSSNDLGIAGRSAYTPEHKHVTDRVLRH